MAFSNYTPSPHPKNFGQPMQETQIGENNSGQGPNTPVPDIVARKFNWAAFITPWIWALGNKVYRIAGITFCLDSLFAHIPYIGGILCLGLAIFCGIKGNQWAWQHKRFESIEHFHSNQKKWAVSVIIVLLILYIILIVLRYKLAVSLSKTESLLNDMSRSEYVYKIENRITMNNIGREKDYLTSNGLALFFEETIKGERINNSIKTTNGDVLIFEGNGLCKQEGDCKVIFQMNKYKKQEIDELPLYYNDNGYIYIKKEDRGKILNTNK